ncbi:MAG: AAA family ATPase [Candidatus Aquicultorales bacterium]
MVPVILAERDEPIVKIIEKALPRSTAVSKARTLEEIEALIKKGEPAVLVIGPGFSLEECEQTLMALEISHPEVGTLKLADELTTDLLRSALRLGVEDVLGMPIDAGPFSEAVQSVSEKSLALANKLYGQLAEVKPSAKPSKANTIAVFSTKGGVGKTFLATNLSAVHAMHNKNERSVLLDFDLQFGDSAVMLQLFPKHTVSDASASIERLDAEMMNGFFTKHGSGADVLIAPLEPELAEFISPEDLVKILSVVKEIADFIIVDLPPNFTDKVLAVLDNCDLIYLVATLDIPSVKNTKLALQTLDLLRYPPEKIRLILNRADSKVELKTQEVEKILGVKITAQVPSDRSVPLSINRGTPVVQEFPRSGVAASVFALHDCVIKELQGTRKVTDAQQKAGVTEGVD